MLNEAIMAHMLLFPETATSGSTIMNRHVCEYTFKSEEILLCVFGNCSLRRQGFTFVCVGGGRRNGCSFLSPPPIKTEKTHLTSPLSIPMDLITGAFSSKTSAPLLTTERVPASVATDPVVPPPPARPPPPLALFPRVVLSPLIVFKRWSWEATVHVPSTLHSCSPTWQKRAPLLHPSCATERRVPAAERAGVPGDTEQHISFCLCAPLLAVGCASSHPPRCRLRCCRAAPRRTDEENKGLHVRCLKQQQWNILSDTCLSASFFCLFLTPWSRWKRSVERWVDYSRPLWTTWRYHT